MTYIIVEKSNQSLKKEASTGQNNRRARVAEISDRQVGKQRDRGLWHKEVLGKPKHQEMRLFERQKYELIG